MSRRSTTSWSIPATIGLIVLLLAGPAPRAAASCGDYVHILPPGAAAAIQGTSGRGGPAGERPVTPQSPCRNGMCDRAPQNPVPPAPPPAPTYSPQDAAAILSLSLPESIAACWLATGPAASPRGAADPIFHPPRS